jgi:uncharacterized protein YndB with AHSA1/START domain
VNERLTREGDATVLHMRRPLAHPPEKVWMAITDPAHLRHWFPADMEMELEQGAKIRFAFREGEGPPGEGEITELDPPRVFAFTWDDNHLRWELHPDGAGCVLELRHTFGDRPGAASFATGWEFCVDALAAILDGREPAAPDGYQERHERRVAEFGLLEGTVEDGVVRFVRQFPYPAGMVWDALTDGSPEPVEGGRAPERCANRAVPPGPVTALDPGRLLEFESGGGGRVRWELTGGPGGGRVILTQPVGGADPAGPLAAWHTHLELLAEVLGGADPRPWPGEREAALRERY